MRVSKEDKKHKESGSITNQRQMLHSFIEQKPEFEQCMVTDYCDDGYSGQNFERPGINKLFQDVKKNKVSCIIVKDFSRFSRDYIEMGDYLERIFPFMGIRFISINDTYDSQNSKKITAEIDTAFKTLLYDFYTKDISIKVKNSIAKKCENGIYSYGKTPFGYKKDTAKREKVIVNQKEAEIVTYIFELAEHGYSPAQIAKRLHRENIPTCMQIRNPGNVRKDRVTCWNNMRIREILCNPFYIGIWDCKQYHFEEHHMPIISREIFEKVNKNCRKGHSTKRKYKKHPLTGILYCGGCNYAMAYKRDGKRHKYRRFECHMHSTLKVEECCTYFNAEKLEEVIITLLHKEIQKLADTKQFSEQIKEKFKIKNREEIKAMKNAQKELKKLDIEKQKKYEVFAETGKAVVEYQQSTEDFYEKERQLSTKIKQLETRLSVYKDFCKGKPDDVYGLLYYAKATELTQEVVDFFINKIKVYNGKRVEIEWKFNMSLD